MDRRIFGIENEYGVTCTFRGQRRLSPDEVARYLFRKVVSWGRSSNVFLRNGARLYLDVGSHPEYATPECDSIADLVVHDGLVDPAVLALAAGAELVSVAKQRARHTLPQDEIFCPLVADPKQPRSFVGLQWGEFPSLENPADGESITIPSGKSGGISTDDCPECASKFGFIHVRSFLCF